jgi:hypothetical protein
MSASAQSSAVSSTAPSTRLSSQRRGNAPYNATTTLPALQRSTFGYATTKPLQREARQVLADRDRREKARNEGGVIHANTNPLTSHAASAGFASSAQRFNPHVAVGITKEEDARRAGVKHNQASIATMRTDREAKRWANMDQQQKRADDDAKALAGTGLRNKGSVGYNLVNQTWGDSNDAARAKFRDDRVEYTAKLRTRMLDNKSNTGGGYDLLTGAPRRVIVIPPVPEYRPPAE